MNSRKLFFLFSILFVFSFAINPTPALSQEIGTIELSKIQVFISCAPGGHPAEGEICDDAKAIAITVFTNKLINGEFTFKYIVTGGQIIGDGSKVSWNLSDTQSGTYKIFAEIRNKSGAFLGKTDSKIITVENCNCIRDCFCPDEISISVSKTIKAGETAFFTANVGGGGGDITYNWTVSKGEIIEGQGTPAIKVATTSEMAGEEIKASVKFGGDAFCSGTCLDEAFAIGKIEKADSTVDVESLTLDKDVVLIGCPPSNYFPKEGSICTDEKPLVKVTTKITKTDEKDLNYHYFVSGGKIIGQGKNVVWDFDWAKPGNYKITVGVSKDFIILGKTLTKTIEFAECSCPHICECPDGVKISGPKNHVKSGDLVVLNAEVSGGGDFISINWKILNGTIVSGQGTSQILVNVDSVKENEILKATVEISNDCEACGTRTETKSIQINKDK